MRTYVVRVQDARASEQPDELRGVADEVATGRRSTFTSGAELLRLLAEAGGGADHPHSGDAE
jgi:hypothetical protein